VHDNSTKQKFRIEYYRYHKCTEVTNIHTESCSSGSRCGYDFLCYASLVLHFFLVRVCVCVVCDESACAMYVRTYIYIHSGSHFFTQLRLVSFRSIGDCEKTVMIMAVLLRFDTLFGWVTHHSTVSFLFCFTLLLYQ
jgi:hypothetical protein